MTLTGTLLSNTNVFFCRTGGTRGVFLPSSGASSAAAPGLYLLQSPVMIDAVQNTAKLVSIVTRDPVTGLGVALTTGQRNVLVVTLKKNGAGSASVITPTLSTVGSGGLLVLALTGAYLDTLGVAVINVSGPAIVAVDLYINVVDDAVVSSVNSYTGSVTAGITSGVNAHTDSATSGITSAVNAHTDTATSGITSGVNAHTDTATFGVTSAVIANADSTASGVIAEIGAHVDATVATAVADLIAASPSSISLRDAVLDAMLQDHSVPGSLADGVAIAAGLLQGNFVMDNVDNTDPNGQTSARLRLWRDEVGAGAATGGGTEQGEFAEFQVTTSYTGPGRVLVHRVVRVIAVIGT